MRSVQPSSQLALPVRSSSRTTFPLRSYVYCTSAKYCRQSAPGDRAAPAKQSHRTTDLERRADAGVDPGGQALPERLSASAIGVRKAKTLTLPWFCDWESPYTRDKRLEDSPQVHSSSWPPAPRLPDRCGASVFRGSYSTPQTIGVGPSHTTVARPTAITSATIPSIRSRLFALSGLMFPAGSCLIATFDAIQARTGLPP